MKGRYGRLRASCSRTRRRLHWGGRGDRGGRGCGARGPAQGCDVGARLRPARRDQAHRLAQEHAGRDHDRRRAQGRGAGPGRPHHPPPVFAALHCPRLDGAVMRGRAVERRRQGGGVVALPGRLRLASRPVAGAWIAAGEHPSCSISKEPDVTATTAPTTSPSMPCCWRARPRAPGAHAMVARGRARLVADGRRDGGRDRGRPRRAG